jgi:hypothetical protein
VVGGLQRSYIPCVKMSVINTRGWEQSLEVRVCAAVYGTRLLGRTYTSDPEIGAASHGRKSALGLCGR